MFVVLATHQVYCQGGDDLGLGDLGLGDLSSFGGNGKFFDKNTTFKTNGFNFEQD